MDFMMKTSIFSQLVIVLAVTTAVAGARAEDRMTAQKWSESFGASIRAKDTKQTLQLIDFNSMDKKVIVACDDCGNKDKMAKARKLYAKGEYDAARELYSQIGKGSAYWLQATEEKAWTYYRQNKFEDSLSQTKTLLSPQFASYVNSESYFLQALAELKSCNYKQVFETNKLFKEKQKARLVEIQTLAKTGTNAAFQNVIASAKAFPLRFSDIGENANHLPQEFYKDIELQRQMMRYALVGKALNILRTQAAQTSEKLQETFEKTQASSLAAMQNRMKQLATAETNDNFKIVQKLNLVEVEAIQRLHIDVELDKKLFKKGNFNDTNAEQLVFVDDGRPWIDELDKYEVRTKACPQNIRRKM